MAEAATTATNFAIGLPEAWRMVLSSPATNMDSAHGMTPGHCRTYDERGPGGSMRPRRNSGRWAARLAYGRQMSVIGAAVAAWPSRGSR